MPGFIGAGATVARPGDTDVVFTFLIGFQPQEEYSFNSSQDLIWPSVVHVCTLKVFLHRRRCVQFGWLNARSDVETDGGGFCYGHLCCEPQSSGGRLMALQGLM